MIAFSGLTESIEDADSIVIFRHGHPDCDAFGSQFGLKSWIEDNYPEKEVHAFGLESVNQGIWPDCEEVRDEIIAKSLIIVTDTSNRERSDDMRFLNGKKIIKIDHHPETDPFGDLNIVNSSAAATCEILADYIATEGKTVSKKTAEYLYKGLLTDTLRFSTSNTTAATLKAAAYLASFGIDIPAINRELFDLSAEEFRLSSLIRSKVKLEPSGFAWLLLMDADLEDLSLSASEARSHINEIGNVRDFKIWAMFTEAESEEGTFFDGSLRSKKAAVNDIASLFGGGGHKNAAGVKHLSYEDLNQIRNLLEQRALEE